MAAQNDPNFLLEDTSGMSLAALADATNRVFEGYSLPVQFTPASYAAFCRQYSLDLACGRVLSRRNGRLVGLTVLGVRGDRGWCGGLGVVPAFRGQGLGARLVASLIEQSRMSGLATVQLEVLVRNDPAIRVYRRAGFEARRELCVLSADAEAVQTAASRETAGEWEILQAGRDDAFRALFALSALSEREAAPCWQREAATLLTLPVTAHWVAVRHGAAAGVLLTSGPQILSLVFGEEGAGRALLARAASVDGGAARPSRLSILNEPAQSRACALLRRVGFEEAFRQHEMWLDLR